MGGMATRLFILSVTVSWLSVICQAALSPYVKFEQAHLVNYDDPGKIALWGEVRCFRALSLEWACDREEEFPHMSIHEGKLWYSAQRQPPGVMVGAAELRKGDRLCLEGTYFLDFEHGPVHMDANLQSVSHKEDYIAIEDIPWRTDSRGWWVDGCGVRHKLEWNEKQKKALLPMRLLQEEYCNPDSVSMTMLFALHRCPEQSFRPKCCKYQDKFKSALNIECSPKNCEMWDWYEQYQAVQCKDLDVWSRVLTLVAVAVIPIVLLSGGCIAGRMLLRYDKSKDV